MKLKNYLGEHLGKCNRLNKCGYHYTPKQFYKANPELCFKAENNFSAIGKKRNRHVTSVSIMKVDFIDIEILKSTLRDYDDNTFVQFLSDLFPDNEELIRKLCVSISSELGKKTEPSSGR